MFRHGAIDELDELAHILFGGMGVLRMVFHSGHGYAARAWVGYIFERNIIPPKRGLGRIFEKQLDLHGGGFFGRGSVESEAGPVAGGSDERYSISLPRPDSR